MARVFAVMVKGMLGRVVSQDKFDAGYKIITGNKAGEPECDRGIKHVISIQVQEQ